MEDLKLSIIKTREQYFQYCDLLEVYGEDEDKYEEEVKLLEFLITNWDEKNTKFKKLSPIEFLKVLMKNHNLNPKELADIIDVTERHLGKILNREKRFSETIIRKLSSHFKISKEVFNRPYRMRRLTRENSSRIIVIKVVDSNKKFASR